MTRQSQRTRQKNERENRKAESNDSPEIPDRRGTSDIPGLPSGRGKGQIQQNAINAGQLLC